MNSIVGVMKKVAEQEVERILTTELGVVTAIFPHAADDDKDNYQCTVTLKNYKMADGEDYELRKVPVATVHMGMTCIPNINDLVLLNFIGGNINAPVIVGRLYNDEDRPPINNEKEVLIQHSITEGGNIKIDNEGAITITSKDEKNIVTINDEKISAESEKYRIVVDVAGDKISITADKDIEIKSSSGTLSLDAKEISIKSQADCTIAAGGNAVISGSKVELNS